MNGQILGGSAYFLKVSVIDQTICQLGEAFKTKKVPNCGKKSPKGGGGSGPKWNKVYISNVDSLWLNFSDFSQIQITEIWPWVLWYMGLILVRYIQHLVHIWPIFE